MVDSIALDELRNQIEQLSEAVHKLKDSFANVESVFIPDRTDEYYYREAVSVNVGTNAPGPRYSLLTIKGCYNDHLRRGYIAIVTCVYHYMKRDAIIVEHYRQWYDDVGRVELIAAVHTMEHDREFLAEYIQKSKEVFQASGS